MFLPIKFFLRKKTKDNNISTNMNHNREHILPKHIGIIMDGNGRWAKKHGKMRSAGHVEGAQRFREVVKYCEKIGIKYLTVYAFSTENWRRPEEEVNGIMKLFKEYLIEALTDFQKENIKTCFIGDRSVLSKELIDLMNQCEEDTKNKTGLVLNIAINYGGRNEIVKAVKELAKECLDGKLLPDDITEQSISQHLYTANQPDPDLIIRPSGEYRTSNFLLWQSAYSEYYFDNILWPDYTGKDLERAIEAYCKRNRRYGGI